LKQEENKKEIKGIKNPPRASVTFCGIILIKRFSSQIKLKSEPPFPCTVLLSFDFHFGAGGGRRYCFSFLKNSS
jgi:hypothetical protein